MLPGNVRQLVPLLLVADMQRSLAYYVDGLGAEIQHRWVVDREIRWVWLAIGGAALMLQTRQQPTASRPGEGVGFWFQCDDAIAIYHEVLRRGLTATEPQVGNGLWDTVLTDPDGYLIHFESPTDVPEETRLSEVAHTGE